MGHSLSKPSRERKLNRSARWPQGLFDREVTTHHAPAVAKRAIVSAVHHDPNIPLGPVVQHDQRHFPPDGWHSEARP